MKAPTLTKSPASQTKRSSTKRSSLALSTCPVGGAGWCPYPFSPEQLERRLKAKAMESSESESNKSSKTRK